MGSWSDAIGFESAMPSFDFPVGLRVVGRSPHMGAAIQNRTKTVKRSTDVQIGNVHMPMLMRPQRLNKTAALQRWLELGPHDQIGMFQHPINTGGTHRHHVPI